MFSSIRSRAPFLSRNFITIVKQGFEAQRTFLGKHPTTLNPGLHLYCPLLHQIRKLDMREGSIQMSELKCYTKDNVPLYVTGTLFYRIIDSYKACFKAQAVVSQVSEVGTSSARSVIGTMAYEDIIAGRDTINSCLCEKIGTSCTEWGVVCTKFEIQSCDPQNREKFFSMLP